jgi:phosphonate transport system ATP-binding protein
LKIQTRHLEARHRAYRSSEDRAIESLNLEIGAGEHVAIIGPSGSGKTTLLEVLACAMKPLSGSLLLDGRDPWQLSKSDLQRLRGHLFLAPQVPPLPPRQRVVTAVLAGRLPTMSLFASLRSLIVPSDLPGALTALERFDLAEKLFERVDQLSGGERQRVGLARALMSPASLWLIDEPLSSLDPARLQQAMQALVDCASERGATLVTTLHQVDAALGVLSANHRPAQWKAQPLTYRVRKSRSKPSRIFMRPRTAGFTATAGCPCHCRQRTFRGPRHPHYRPALPIMRRT